MKIGNLVRFVGRDDPYKDKLGVITLVDRWDVQVRIPETNEKIWRLSRHLELVK